MQLEDEHNSDGDDNFSDGSDEEMAEPEAGEIAETCDVLSLKNKVLLNQI